MQWLIVILMLLVPSMALSQPIGGGGSSGSVTQGTTPWISSTTVWGGNLLGGATGWGVIPSGNVIGANVNCVAGCSSSTSLTNWGGAAVGAASAWGGVPSGNVIGANVNCVAGCSSSTAITSWAGGTLGAMANFGTSPGAVLVPGMNAWTINNGVVKAGNTAAVGDSAQVVADPNVLTAINNPIPACGATPCATTIGNVGRVALPTGGSTVSSAIAPATPTGVNLKASAGTVYGIQATTIQATPVYVKLYNSATAPTCGSGTPIARFMVPAANTAANGSGTNIHISVGMAFGTGIGYCVTGAIADNDTTAITTTNTIVNIEWN